jgi:hypothetical protein
MIHKFNSFYSVQYDKRILLMHISFSFRRTNWQHDAGLDLGQDS